MELHDEQIGKLLRQIEREFNDLGLKGVTVSVVDAPEKLRKDRGWDKAVEKGGGE